MVPDQHGTKRPVEALEFEPGRTTSYRFISNEYKVRRSVFLWESQYGVVQRAQIWARRFWGNFCSGAPPKARLRLTLTQFKAASAQVLRLIQTWSEKSVGGDY